MSEGADDASPSQNGTSPRLPPWMRVTAEDIAGLDFEAPINLATASDCNELSELYQSTATGRDGSADPFDTPEGRAFVMLSALTGMQFKPEERNEPFGPMMVFNDGRSAIPSDFRSHTDLLANMADRAKNPMLRARLSDVCWLLDPKRGTLGLAAVAAYTEIAHKIENGELKHRFGSDADALPYDARNCLLRALHIGRAVGWDKPQTLEARHLVKRLRGKAVANGPLAPVRWFSDLDLSFGVSDPAEIGRSLDSVLTKLPADSAFHGVADLWRLTARAYQLAGMDGDRNRCLTEAAEVLVTVAAANQGSAMLASHLLSTAIAQLHGVPGKKDRRTELRHKLVDIQSRTSEEMSVFSQRIDCRDIAELAQKAVSSGSLLEKLLNFCTLSSSPEPEKLTNEAKQTIENYPLSSLFGTWHLDHEGKVIHRTQGAGLGDVAHDSAVLEKIAQNESLRRKFVVAGLIEPGRQTIVERHFVSDDVLIAILQYSPFVPHDLINTFARAYARFFQGDMVSAIYIVTPLLENSLRHLLRSNGHDVTIFDDVTQIQEDRTISSLFKQMRPELDSVFTPAITADIERLFLKKPGPYLRHALAHGLLHDGDPYGADAIYACWLIFRLCLLPLYQDREWLRSMLAGSEL
jgi:hypothetical protein